MDQELSGQESNGRCSISSDDCSGVIVHRGVKPLYVSEGWAAAHGYDVEEILAMPSIEPLRHPGDRERMISYAVERSAGRHAPDRYAYRAMHRRGGYNWVDVKVQTIDWKGKPAIRCIIEQRRGGSATIAGQASEDYRPLNKAELRLLNVIDQLPDGYALYDADECLVFWNQRYADYVPKIGGGYRSGDQFEAMLRDQVQHGRIRDAVGQEETWIASRLEAFRAANNQSLDLDYNDRVIRARHIGTGDGGTLLILSDVTETKRAEDSLRTYASALEQVADRVSIIGTDYRYFFVNASVLRSYGKSKDDIIGRHIADLIGKDQFEQNSKADLDRCFSGFTVRTEREQRDVEGTLRHLDVKLEPFRKDDGDIVGAIVVMRDVTEATERNRELQLAMSAIDQIHERIVVVDKDHHVRMVNQSHLRFHGRDLGEVLGKHFGELIGWSRYRSGADKTITQAIEDGIDAGHNYWRTGADGKARYWETSVVPFRDSDSKISGAIGTSRDMTEYRQAEQARRQFQDAIEHLADGYALFDEEERLTACNVFYERMNAPLTPGFGIGVSFEAIIRGRVAANTVLDAIGREEDWIAQRLETFRAESYIGDFRVTGGRWVHIRNRRTADGGTLLMVTDVTESKRIEEALAYSETRFKDFTELATDWFWEQDAEGRFTYYSESFETLTKWRIREFLGKTSLDAFSNYVLADPTWLALWHEQQTTGIDRTVEFEHDLPTADGKTLRVSTTLRPAKNAAGVIVGYRGAARDITAAYRLKKQLDYQANHDALTDLPNRRSFELHLEQAIDTSTAGGHSSAFCFIDLDQFKVVNDTAGHLAGDRLLQQVATLLASLIRKNDLLARLGGDEFGLLMRDCSLRRAQHMASRLLIALNNDRFFHNESVFEIGASIGVTSIKSTSATSVSQILAEADLACYAAKDQGRNRVQVYQDEDHQLSRRREDMSRAGLILWALDNNRFDLFAQPITPLCRQCDSGRRYEILLRMVGMDGSYVQPESFIPAAEQYGLMVKVDRWVIRQTMMMLARRPHDRVNINLSGLSLNEDDTVDFIKSLLVASPVNPEHICFEITETAAISCLSNTKYLIDDLKETGCRFALDDFGNGLSSFNYLKKLPVDYLKIDGAFIRDILTDKHSWTMVQAIHQIAKSLDLETVAECVENNEAVETLRAIGIDFIQGFAVGRPEPLAAGDTQRKAAV